MMTDHARISDALVDPEYRLPKGRFRPIEKPQASSFWVGLGPSGFTAKAQKHFDDMAQSMAGATLAVAQKQGTL